MNTSNSLIIDNPKLTQKIIDSIIHIANEKILNSDIELIELDNILNGKLGLAYYCYFTYHLKGNKKYLKIIEKILDNVFRTLTESDKVFSTNLTLADGFSGLGIVLNNLVKDKILDEEYIDQIIIINDLAYTNCKKMIKNGGFDYFYGATGLLFYLSEVDSLFHCEDIINDYHNYAINNNYLFYNNTVDVYTQGVNFGYAHGTLSILEVFLKLHDKGICKEKTKELILNTVDSLLQFSREKINFSEIKHKYVGYEYPSFFPYNIMTDSNDKIVYLNNKDNIFHYTDRLGWCNSDLGHILMLYKIGKKFNIKNYINIANKMGEITVKRKEYNDTAISDCYICHGSSGVAQLYKKIYEISDNEIYNEAYKHWLNETINYMQLEIKKTFSVQDLELLTGWLGPLLTLHSFKGEIQNSWDKIFLM